jgi:MoxR-like ATPase
MLKMCAFTNGRRSVSEFDTLLLKHVCWSSPSEQGKIEEWLLDQLISQTETKQLRYLLLGVFTRCCKAMNNTASSKDKANANSLTTGEEVATDIEELGDTYH